MLNAEYDFSHFQENACINVKGKSRKGDTIIFEAHVYIDDTTNKVSFEFIRNKASEIMHYYAYINRLVRKLTILDTIENEIIEKSD